MSEQTYKVGIDLGGTFVKAGVIDAEYHIIGTAKLETRCPRPAEEIADTIKATVLLALENAGITLEQVEFVGIGTPGGVNSEGIVEFSPNLDFHDVPLKILMEERLLKPCAIGNDANVAALGEQIAGCGNGVPNFIMVTLGTGVGGGIILDKRLLIGINGQAGEIGHMVIETGGIACQCGRTGCFEKYASTSALVQQTKDALYMDRDKTSVMWGMTDGDLERINGFIICNAVREGDKLANEVFNNFVRYLAVGVTNLINIFQPDMICLGGGISKEGDFLIQPLIKEINKRRFDQHAKKQTQIVAATLGNDAGIIGAALLGDAGPAL